MKPRCVNGNTVYVDNTTLTNERWDIRWDI